MPAKAPAISKKLQKQLREIGQQLRARRKDLKISAVVVAEAAEMSRVTLYRIEKGEASVAIGAYLSVSAALGLSLELKDPVLEKNLKPTTLLKLPKQISLAHYKQLKQLAWQLKDSKTLSPLEALELYERNWRHLDMKSMDAKEKELIELLKTAFRQGRLLV